MRHLLMPLFCAAGPVLADPPMIEEVRFAPSGGCQFAVTLSHPDTGWDHYADGWRVEDAAGHVLGTRVLLHPHVTEQPFTRCLGGVPLPEGTTEVFVRARCSVDGWAATTTRVLVQTE